MNIMRTVGRIFFIVSMLVVPLSAGNASAAQPPAQADTGQNQGSATFEDSVSNIVEIGYNKGRPELVERANNKLRALLDPSGRAAMKPPYNYGIPTTGTIRGVVFPIAFLDYPPNVATETIKSKFFGDGDPAGYPVESLKKYYQRSSYNKLTIDGDVMDWYVAPYNIAAAPGVKDIFNMLFNYYDQRGIDFSKYDSNGDGLIDFFTVVHTGSPAGRPDYGNWANHASNAFDLPEFDGKQPEGYSFVSSSDSPNVNTEIHEMGHVLGLPDLYDYYNEPGFGPDGGVGDLDMMDGKGGDHNSFSKFILDWLTPAVYATGSYNEISLSSLDIAGDSAIIMPNIKEGEPFAEYFVVENRNQSGNDSGNDPNGNPFHPGRGLVIWHVDAQLDSSGFDFLYNNSWTDHKLLRLMEADGLEEIETAARNADAEDYYVQGSVFTPNSVPNNNRYSGGSSGFAITNISPPGATMTFSLVFDNTAPSDIASINDGTGADIDFATSGTTLSANWTESSDPESGVIYRYCIGTSSGATDTVDWTTTSSTSLTRSDLTLASGTTYFFTVKSVNGVDMESSAVTSDGVSVAFQDISPPSAPVIEFYPEFFCTQYLYINFWWNPATDNESGIASYWYAVGTATGATDVVGWTNNAKNLSVRLFRNIPLVHNQRYYISVKAVNGEGLVSEGYSSGILADGTTPTIAWVNDSLGEDIDETTNVTRMSANWSPASDPESGLSAYSFSIGTSPGATDTVGTTRLETLNTYVTIDLPKPLEASRTYYFSVYAYNNVNMAGAPFSSDGVIFHSGGAPSDVAEVIDGFGKDIDASTDKTQLKERWTASYDSEYGISRYWYAVGTSPGATDTVNWTDNGANQYATISGLNLASDTTYYTTVKAENGAGRFSNPVSSDGVAVTYDIAPSGPTISSGWNLIGTSRKDVSFQTSQFFASGTVFEILSYNDQNLTCLTSRTTQTFSTATGYWIYSDTALGTLELGGNNTVGPTYSISLTDGWNIISLPYEAVVKWGDEIAAPYCGSPYPSGLPPIYEYTGSGWTKIIPGAGIKIYPWKGYMIKADGACTLYITLPTE